MKYLLIFCLGLISLTVTSQSMAGVWNSYDSDGKLDSKVKITIKDGKLYGKLIKLYNSDGSIKTPKCTNCKGSRKDQPLTGMVFITGLKQSGKYWKGDKAIFYPKNGKSYDVKLWLENDNKLAVRGYLGWFYETHYWKRAK